MKKKLNRKDFIIICAVTVLYAVLAFINLGDMHAPQTKPAAADRLALMRFADTESIDEIIYYKGLGDGEIASTLRKTVRSGNFAIRLKPAMFLHGINSIAHP